MKNYLRPKGWNAVEYDNYFDFSITAWRKNNPSMTIIIH